MKWLCKAAQYLAPMVHDPPPEVVHLAADLNLTLVRVPAPMGIGAHVIDAPSADLGGEHRATTVQPKPRRLVVDIDASFGQKVLDVAQR